MLLRLWAVTADGRVGPLWIPSPIEALFPGIHRSRHHLIDSGEQALVDAMVDPLPRDHFPADGRAADTTVQLLKEELLLDGNSKQNLATFCQTYQGSAAMELMALGVDKNLIDKDEYPQTAEVERRCVSMMADLWNAPGEAIGCSTIGSSEASMLGGMAAKWR